MAYMLQQGQNRKLMPGKFLDGIKETLQYFGDNSNLHGVAHVFSMAYISVHKRLFWIIILTCCGLGAATILKGALSLYSEGAISYSVETNWLHWDTSFPALTVCEQMDADRVKARLNRLNIPGAFLNFYKEVSFWNAKYCRTCSSCKINETCADNFKPVLDEIRMKCSELLTDCWWDDKPFPCCERFHPTQTEYGVCFAFNSRLSGNDSGLLSVNRRIGLPSLVFSAVEAVMIRVHSPDDVVSVALENVIGKSSLVMLVTDLDIILRAEQTASDVSVQSVPPSVRGCLYDYERPEFAVHWPFRRYSFSACALYCRAQAQEHTCNCTHHFMPKLGDIPFCNIQGLSCLSKHKDALDNAECECPMACEEVQYRLVHTFYSRETDKLSQELLNRGSRGRIRLAELPNLRVRRQAIRGTLGLVVDIGGVGGVFFGASILSVIEIVYLLCIRR